MLHYTSYQQNFSYLQNFGAIGVDLFFVISGFIITLVSRNYYSGGNGLKFLAKRFLRIAPVYWFVSLFYYFLDYANKGDENIIKTFVFFPFLDSVKFKMPMLSVGWTLSFEVYFYLATGLFLLAGFKKYIEYVILFFIMLVLSTHFVFHKSVLLTFLGNPIIIEFIFGCSIGLIYLSGYKFSIIHSRLIAAAGLILFFANVFYNSGNISEVDAIINGSLSFKRVILWGIPSGLVVLGFVLCEHNENLHIPGWLIKIGDASYSIYLIHHPLTKILFWEWYKFHVPYPDFLIFITLAIILATGYLFYRFAEKPLLNKLNLLVAGNLKQS